MQVRYMKSSASDSKPFQSRYKGEIPSQAKQNKRLSYVKLNQAFLTDSLRRTFHVLYSMYQVRLMKSLASWVVSITSCSPMSYVSPDPNKKSEEFLWVGVGSTLVVRLYFFYYRSLFLRGGGGYSNLLLVHLRLKHRRNVFFFKGC